MKTLQIDLRTEQWPQQSPKQCLLEFFWQKEAGAELKIVKAADEIELLQSVAWQTLARRICKLGEKALTSTPAPAFSFRWVTNFFLDFIGQILVLCGCDYLESKLGATFEKSRLVYLMSQWSCQVAKLVLMFLDDFYQVGLHLLKRSFSSKKYS